MPLMPAHESRHIGPTEVIGFVNGLHPVREKRLDRYEFPELTKRGEIPPPPLSPLPEPDPSTHTQDYQNVPSLPDGQAGSNDQRNHTNGHTLWNRNRKFPNGYVDPDKRY
jgi:type IV secretory pathway TraG/TraD family ATPase VirD4